MPPQDRRIPDLVSASEAAEMLGITRQAVQLMANNGQLVGRKIGKAGWVFRRSVVEAEIADREQRKSRSLEKAAEALEHPETFVKRERPKRGSA